MPTLLVKLMLSVIPAFPDYANLFGGTNVHFMYIRYQINFYANLNSSTFVCNYILLVSCFYSALTLPIPRCSTVTVPYRQDLHTPMESIDVWTYLLFMFENRC
jgi:hypothetical protein